MFRVKFVTKLLLCGLILISVKLFSQESVEVLNPPGQNWQKIENEKSTIIYPEGIEHQAKRVASIVDDIAKKQNSSIGSKVINVPIILHTQSMEANGFVATAPFRSEFYPLGIADWNITGTNNWTDLLAIHEYRHVLQSSNTLVGITKLGRILTGQFGWGTMRLLTSPNWFAEGDAVVSETVFTDLGRGRLPSFTFEQRALQQADKKVSYVKARHGSYKTQMPSHYPFGYQMALYARKEFGNDIWSKVVRDANQFDRIFYPFSGALKKNTGLRPKQLYRKAYDELNSNYSELLSSREFSKLINLTEPQKTVTEYSYPHIFKGRIIARKSSYKQTAHLVSIHEGKEKKLTDIGHNSNAYVSYTGSKAAWVEIKQDPYYQNKDFQRLIIYDFEKDEKTIHLDGKRLFYAALSPEADKIFTIEFDMQMRYSLNLYDREREDKLSEFLLPEGYEVAYPLFDSMDDNVVYLALKSKGKEKFVAYRTDSKTFSNLTEEYAHVMIEPSQSDTHLFFRASFDGIDNIYAVPKDGSKRISKVTSAKIGAGFPFVNGQELIFSDYHVKGNNLAKTPLSLQPYQPHSPKSMEIYSAVNGLPENDLILNHLPDKNYQPEKYNSIIGGWRFHSWGILPAFSQAEGQGFPGLSQAEGFVRMDNLLSTQALNLNTTYFLNEGETEYGFDYSLAAFFPVIQVGYNFRDRSVPAPRGNRLLEFKEQEAHAGIRIPLETVKNNFTYSTNLGAFWKGIQPFQQTGPDSYLNDPFGLYELNGSFSVLRRRAYQNLQSRFGASVSGTFSQSLQQGMAGLYRFGGTVYLPGVSLNHGVRITAATHFESLENTYQFPDNFSSARGFAVGGLEQVNRLAFNYQLPLLYPDLGIPGITYIRRLRANLFYDVAEIRNSTAKTNIASVGMELLADQVALNILPIPVGVRLGYRLKNDLISYDSPFFINLMIGE
ncbi:hypothetical protein [Jiulongibacter sediminis]|uniref:Bacterial surface antigen (D15) domain-containing protein n=1 Tax=Jiulongibacter sediminis TaxID=1605367 RepID=A0A0P7BWS1_9BACT|nr:hypothetical protein [Jiulongibacter sediminis]KPM49389.1 hypothetical protein AFM12_01870 [Jiulongibacter sediminis]TBX26438.1 hypothetical protein TK44_01875 [Jiulongibacter sediminis]